MSTAEPAERTTRIARVAYEVYRVHGMDAREWDDLEPHEKTVWILATDRACEAFLGLGQWRKR